MSLPRLERGRDFSLLGSNTTRQAPRLFQRFLHSESIYLQYFPLCRKETLRTAPCSFPYFAEGHVAVAPHSEKAATGRPLRRRSSCFDLGTGKCTVKSKRRPGTPGFTYPLTTSLEPCLLQKMPCSSLSGAAIHGARSVTASTCATILGWRVLPG